MEYVIGVIVAAAVGVFASLVGLDRERGFYAVVLIVVASYYLLFAAMAQSNEALISEGIAGIVFISAAAVGFRRTGWILVAGVAMFGT